MRNIRLIIVLGVVYIDMLGIGLAYPILPKLIEHFNTATLRTLPTSSVFSRPVSR